MITTLQERCTHELQPNHLNPRGPVVEDEALSEHGWTVNRLRFEGGVPNEMMRAAIYCGLVPTLAGTKCVYIDPLDVAAIPALDWSVVTPALLGAMRESALRRLRANLRRTVAARDGAA